MHSLRGSHFIRDGQVCMEVVFLTQQEALVFWSLARSGGGTGTRTYTGDARSRHV